MLTWCFRLCEENNSKDTSCFTVWPLTMTGFGSVSSTHTQLSGCPNRQPRDAPARDSSFRCEEEPRQKAQVMRDRLLFKGFWDKSEKTTRLSPECMRMNSFLINHLLPAGVTCTDVLLLQQRVHGSRLQDELALLARLQLLRLHGPLSVCRWRRGVPACLRRRVSHVTHLDAERKLVT